MGVPFEQDGGACVAAVELGAMKRIGVEKEAAARAAREGHDLVQPPHEIVTEAGQAERLEVGIVGKRAMGAFRGEGRPAVDWHVMDVHEHAQASTAPIVVPESRRICLGRRVGCELEGGIRIEARRAAEIAADRARERLVVQQRLERLESRARGDEVAMAAAHAMLCQRRPCLPREGGRVEPQVVNLHEAIVQQRGEQPFASVALPFAARQWPGRSVGRRAEQHRRIRLPQALSPLHVAGHHLAEWPPIGKHEELQRGLQSAVSLRIEARPGPRGAGLHMEAERAGGDSCARAQRGE